MLSIRWKLATIQRVLVNDKTKMDNENGHCPNSFYRRSECSSPSMFELLARAPIFDYGNSQRSLAISSEILVLAWQ